MRRMVRLRGEMLLGIPLNDEEKKKIISLNVINNLKDYIIFIKFKDEMIQLANEHFKIIATEKKKILLDNKNDLMRVLDANSQRSKLNLSQFRIMDITEYIMNELLNTIEKKKIEQEVYDHHCALYRDEYYDYRDRQFDAAFENMHSNWANNKLVKDLNPEWKKSKWNIWVHYFSDILQTLKIKDQMIYNSILHLKTVSNSCKEIYDVLTGSLIDTYKEPFLSEYNSFIYSSIDEWNQKLEREKDK
ncbi:conserved Plasmodium protein, unknown function [Plasmodium ovale wallikeri]|uniref:Plasmodium RESA N-terminal domain-containing protein n=1 Tax=Plasmodium ovale wallikeri TaxID=864142 RepID=A0A1A8YH53_PLAOA|nr:conserved Plasmodium protein, unknown function [Plasmodium ovale wallikeri]SBT31502.1 conserved Plasmodium protein, unknown function [Plasmodium ovale wallikeri]